MNNKVTLGDNMEFMKNCKDNQFDLAIVDPPYGINVNHSMGRRKGELKSDYKKVEWDSEPPPIEYFHELFRISKHSIIWGANHFMDLISKRSSCWLVWDKKFSNEVSFASCELAFTTFDKVVKRFEYSSARKNGIHPTQKPVALYKWLLKNYAKPGDKIFDSHVGSGSIRIACHDMGFDFTGCEIDEDYYNDQETRFKTHTKQGDLFSGVELQESIYK